LRSFVIFGVPRLVKAIDAEAQQRPAVDRDNLYATFGFPIAAIR
jgi:hypothetical protein